MGNLIFVLQIYSLWVFWSERTRKKKKKKTFKNFSVGFPKQKKGWYFGGPAKRGNKDKKEKKRW